MVLGLSHCFLELLIADKEVAIFERILPLVKPRARGQED
jgi:hypothetical protein